MHKKLLLPKLRVREHARRSEVTGCGLLGARPTEERPPETSFLDPPPGQPPCAVVDPPLRASVALAEGRAWLRAGMSVALAAHRGEARGGEGRAPPPLSPSPGTAAGKAQPPGLAAGHVMRTPWGRRCAMKRNPVTKNRKNKGEVIFAKYFFQISLAFSPRKLIVKLF